jgi:hypothetical protein
VGFGEGLGRIVWRFGRRIAWRFRGILTGNE